MRDFSISLIVILLFLNCSCSFRSVMSHQYGKSDKAFIKKSEGEYNSIEMLSYFSKVLNESIPEFRNIHKSGFSVKDKQPVHFFVFDLSDTLNNTFRADHSIEFIEGHIYHFCPKRYPYNLSHIAYLSNDTATVFRSIDCNERGMKLADVKFILEEKLKGREDSKELLQRVEDHKKYGKYYKIDSMARLLCE